MTARSNLYVNQGTDFFTNLELFSGESGDQADLSNFIFYGGVKKLYSSTKLFDMEVTPNDSEPLNDIIIYISAAKTQDKKPGKYQYDILMVDDTTGNSQKILEGLLIIIPTISEIPT